MNETFEIGEKVKFFTDGGFFTCKIISLDEFGVFLDFKCRNVFAYFDEIYKL